MERRDDAGARGQDRSPEWVGPPADDPARDPEGKAPDIAGSVVGAGAGLALGVSGGPVGMVIGALAGAVGGWWATDKITEGMGPYTEDDDRWYREHYETPRYRLADRSYEDVRPAYLYGHLAAHNPAHRGRSFPEVASVLQRDWTTSLGSRHGEWSTARRYAQVGFERRSQRGSSAAETSTDEKGNAPDTNR